LIVIGGTCVAWQGQPLLQAASPVAFFEWRKRDEVTNAAPVDFSVTALFEELTNGSRPLWACVDHSPAPYAEKH
jgi:hypothetical protein